MFDFAADARDQGGEPGMNHKGIVTFDRKIKKDSFYIYKAWWSDQPFVPAERDLEFKYLVPEFLLNERPVGVQCHLLLVGEPRSQHRPEPGQTISIGAVSPEQRRHQRVFSLRSKLPYAPALALLYTQFALLELFP